MNPSIIWRSHIPLVLTVSTAILCGCSDSSKVETLQKTNETASEPSSTEQPQYEKGVPVSLELRQVNGAALEPKVESVSNAFLFLNGKYVPAPYQISVHFDHFEVNGIAMKRMPKHPMRGSEVLYQELLPDVPNEITETSSWSVVEKISTNGEGWVWPFSRYYFSHFPPEEALKKFQEAVRELPFVASAEVIPAPAPAPDEGRKYLRVISKAGDTREFFTSWWNPASKIGPGFDRVHELPDLRPYPQNVIDKELNKQARNLYEMIAAGEIALISLNNKGSIRVTPKREPKRWEEVVNMVRILDSSLDRDAKIREIIDRIVEDPHAKKKSGINWNIVKELVDNYKPDAQLNRRLKILESKMMIPLWLPQLSG